MRRGLGGEEDFGPAVHSRRRRVIDQRLLDQSVEVASANTGAGLLEKVLGQIQQRVNVTPIFRGDEGDGDVVEARVNLAQIVGKLAGAQILDEQVPLVDDENGRLAVFQDVAGQLL